MKPALLAFACLLGACSSAKQSTADLSSTDLAGAASDMPSASGGDLSCVPYLDGGVLPAVCCDAVSGDACDPAAQYCQSTSGGAQMRRAWPNTATGCLAYPAACAADHSCACVRAHQPPGVICDCTSVGAQVVVRCYLP